jgi:flavodoxin
VIGQEKLLKNEVGKVDLPMMSLIVVFSYHHNNTQKVAEAMAKVLDAQVKSPQEIGSDELKKYGPIGFGAGIDSGKHYRELLDFADALPQVTDKKAFIFSTSGVTGEKKLTKDHSALREKLQSRGYLIVDEFQCKGFNTNSFLKYFGGINKGRPNSEDLKHAEEFASKLKE